MVIWTFFRVGSFFAEFVYIFIILSFEIVFMNFMNYDKLNSFFRKNWQWFALVIIVLVGIWLRIQPLKNLQCLEGMVCLQALDPYYFYRHTLYLIENNFHVMAFDPFRYFPVGTSPYNNFQMIYYTPAVIYTLIHSVLPSLTFMKFAQIFPAVLGGVFAVPMYLIGKELYNKYVGLIAAALLVFSQSILYRTSAGFFEKESTAGIFMLFAVYFFVRAFKKKSYLSAIIAGLFTALMNAAWSGVSFLFLFITLFTFIYIFFNPKDDYIENSYIIFILIGIVVINLFGFSSIAVNLQSSFSLICYSLCVFIIAKKLVWKFCDVSGKRAYYVYPLITVIGGGLFLIMSVFIDSFAMVIMFISSLIFQVDSTMGSLSVIDTTVAENAGASWGDIIPRLSVDASIYTISSLKHISFMFFSFNLFSLMLAGIVFLLYLIYRERKIEYIFALVWLGGAILGSFMRIRVIYFIGPPAALAGAFFLYKLFDYLIHADFWKISLGSRRINLAVLLVGIYLVFASVTNIASAYYFSSNMGSSFNDNWQEAMQWVQDNTDDETVLMSWWDYGYWFQTGGRRFSMADGGNSNHTRNYELAHFFTENNDTKWLPYLDEHSVDYIVVDYTLIGKYAPMSKIANLGYKVDSFVSLGRPAKVIPKDDKNIYVYNAVGGVFQIPISSDGRLDGDIKVMFGPTTGYMKYLCTPDGYVQITDKESAFDACLLFTPYGLYMPYPNKDPGISNFAKLFLFDGEGVSYVEKVFDNSEIKIFKVINTEDEIKNPYPNYLADNPLGVY